ncbi:hypothetical protein [Nostoc sp.]|uniref:hypothetical protein n=1 Tax=Nostoc sp. TaxID=1180 RepID=UPI002FF86BAF
MMHVDPAIARGKCIPINKALLSLVGRLYFLEFGQKHQISNVTHPLLKNRSKQLTTAITVLVWVVPRRLTA